MIPVTFQNDSQGRPDATRTSEPSETNVWCTNLMMASIESLYCLQPPFPKQEKRTIFHLPTPEKTSAIKSEKISEEEQSSNGNAPSRSAPSGSAQRPPDEDGRKCPAETGL